MGRKKANITIEAEGRDQGKVFVINEMDCDRVESWAARALLALMAANVEMPAGMEELGMAGMVEMGFKSLSGLKWEVAKPLLDEMFECVEIIPDPKKAHVQRPLVPSDIEEVATRIKLRMEVFQLHTNFSLAGDHSALSKKVAQVASSVRGTRTSRA